MQIGEAVHEALMSNKAGLFGIIADWIEDHRMDHREAKTYLHRLRSPRVRMRTAIDVVCKFGTRAERKIFCRINRIVLELRHNKDRTPRLAEIHDLFTLEGRKQVNRIVRKIPTARVRKKPILASMRKREALHNEVWYVQAFKILLSKYY